MAGHQSALSGPAALRLTWLLPGLAAVALAALWLSLDTGSAGISLSEALRLPASSDARIVWELRLPRSLSALVTGALLGVAGTLMQVLLRNPLADPYILGVSGGASVGALAALLLGGGAVLTQTSAFAGALLSILLVFVLAGARGNWVGTRLLLTGVVLASGWGALVSLILVIAPAARLHGMLFWLMGDLSQAPLPITASAVLLLVGLTSVALSSSLDLLAGGALHAAALGVAVARVRVSIYLMASLATAVAVTQAGSIGFIGLLAPHLLRLCGVTQHRQLLPSVMLLGGTLLLLADTLARSVIAPSQLPVGSLTALLGVPLFLALLYRSRGVHDG